VLDLQHRCCCCSVSSSSSSSSSSSAAAAAAGDSWFNTMKLALPAGADYLIQMRYGR
jgi:hypothetical protein